MALDCVMLAYDLIMREASMLHFPFNWGCRDNINALAVLRGVCKVLRTHIKNYRLSPEISYQFFLKYTRSRCAFEISTAIETWPLYEFNLEVKHDSLSRKMRCIAQNEIAFYQLDEKWTDTMKKKWGVLSPLEHATAIAISGACNKAHHYTNIHKTYAAQPIAIMRLRTYVYAKLVQLADLA